MPDNTHTTASGVFRLAWRGGQHSTTVVVRLRTVNMYLPQPVASCLRSPPAATLPPALAPVVFLSDAVRLSFTCSLASSMEECFECRNCRRTGEPRHSWLTLLCSWYRSLECCGEDLDLLLRGTGEFLKLFCILLRSVCRLQLLVDLARGLEWIR